MPAKVDRQVKHIKKGYTKKGMSAKKAESIAWATINKNRKSKSKKKK
jgi:hypothetical protein